ncbi:DUF4345 domain-containing protein [Nocardia sp. CDC159]|uniref:DUF4345 domain-containing protein n=1 Tax=Nocardia pulmonis TaxID=2951408 RepID=A0A9X2J0W2_9NOCA|nr:MULTISPECIES: DUF4345 family protein [Nocardia]MCM6778988.1 DUF4345 domain-containing protein [Nocardia pulmonis]MCM6791873.1 DUF4345 domain-containing protein [Nocardia sp. CDC159]
MRIVVLAAAGVLFLGMGMYALAAPAGLARPFGFSVSSAVGRAEIRAVYGGFGVAVAMVLGWAAAGDDALRAGAALTVGVALAGMAVGRVVSRILDTATPFYPIWFYCLVEAFGAAAVIAVA